VRIDLCASENLSAEDTYFAGPNHPALGELVIGEIYYMNIKSKLENLELIGNEKVFVKIAKGQTSKAVGQKKKNRLRLLSDFNLSDIRFIESNEINGYDVIVGTEERTYKCI
jgi:hypothetical protein